ncbi:LytTR family transcriptional regulator DNA-binding domain-containing protein [Bacteroides ovatus]|uniref:LytTR family transcriptional regulator DNA-binding domain-containing protein n=2 Tax=Bacteroides ovatus TaxID=28116 RepID=UPI001E556C65|nr:LytTR family transcriptional regulator DNA-binding domain-containing protein [Bacteroides ovatus]
MIRKRIYLTAAIFLLVVSFSAYYLYRVNRSARSRLEYANGLIEVNPRKALADVEQINRTFLSERNYMMCNLVKAGALIGMQEYLVPDSLLNIVSPYFKYKADSLHLTEIYYYRGEIARHSNFLLEAVEYFTLCTQYNNDVYDLRELNFYLNNFKGQVYHTKHMMKEEKEAKLAALSLAKELNNPSLIAEAYSELTHYYARTNDGDESIPLFKTASMKGYSGSLQARLLFLLSEKYADKHMPDSARIYALQIPHLYQDSVDYLLGKIHSDLQQIDSARFYLNRSSQSNNPFICLKAYRQLTDLNIRTGSLNGVSDCLERLTHYQAQIDSVAYNKDLAQIENVDKLRKTIRDSEVAEAEYYRYRVFYCWIIVIAFTVILILMSISIVLQKKKKNLQLKRQQSRLDALKMQIDPHFIFNNLSILLDLVETGDATAPIYIKCLSKVYRHIVANVDKNLSSVADELSSLEAYIFLLKIRFEDAIQVEIQVQDAIRKRQIPPIVLQMLLENAIKHNQVSEEAPLFIRVYSDGDKLVVENNCKPLTPNSSTHHIGLRNIKERIVSPIIFTTAYDQYAIQAFKFNSIDYLLKPIDSDELEAAIQKATERISRSSPVTTAPKLEQLLEYLGGAVPTPHYRERFLVSRKDEYITIEVQNVCFIHSQQNITRLYLTDGTSATIPYTLDQLEKEMNPASFFRANRQHMIQVRHIKKVSNWFNYKLKVEMNGYPQEEILISREKAATFKKWLDK